MEMLNSVGPWRSTRSTRSTEMAPNGSRHSTEFRARWQGSPRCEECHMVGKTHFVRFSRSREIGRTCPCAACRYCQVLLRDGSYASYRSAGWGWQMPADMGCYVVGYALSLRVITGVGSRLSTRGRDPVCQQLLTRGANRSATASRDVVPACAAICRLPTAGLPRQYDSREGRHYEAAGHAMEGGSSTAPNASPYLTRDV